jgi:hypothetical protein
MTRLLRLTLVIALTAPLLLASGCKQGIGDRCQVQSDCDDGLLCSLPNSGSVQSGGTCQAPTSGATDMAVLPGADLSSTEMGTCPTCDM